MGCLPVEHFRWLHYAVFSAAGMVWHRMKQRKTQYSMCLYTIIEVSAGRRSHL